MITPQLEHMILSQVTKPHISTTDHKLLKQLPHLTEDLRKTTQTQGNTMVTLPSLEPTPNHSQLVKNINGSQMKILLLEVMILSQVTRPHISTTDHKLLKQLHRLIEDLRKTTQTQDNMMVIYQSLDQMPSLSQWVVNINGSLMRTPLLVDMI